MSTPAITDLTLTEAEAREVLLVQAMEAAPENPHWSAEDRRWAGRAATQALGADAPRERWIVERARLALQRLGPRVAGLQQIEAMARWRSVWASAAVGLGLFAGLVSDALLAGAYFNLLSLPFFGLLGWNLALYGWMAARAIRGPSRPGPLQQGLGQAMGRWLRRAGPASTWGTFAQRWLSLSSPLTMARMSCVLHLAAAALALGLLGGMYARALVYDYRAGWATTLLTPAQVHEVLATTLAPAQRLSGIPVPGLDAIAELRVTPTTTAQAGAAPWLHLMALTLAWSVLLPRSCLAALAAWRAQRMARNFPLDLTGAYFDRLRAATPHKDLRLVIVAHGQPASAPTRAGLTQWLDMAFGATVPLVYADPVAYGDEEAAGLRPGSPGRALLLFDLSATPEDEVHGRLVRALSGHPLLIVDSAEFVRRFGAGARLAERRRTWAEFADRVGLPLLVVDLSAPDDASAAQLRAALEH